MIFRIVIFSTLFITLVFAQSEAELTNKFMLAQHYEQAGDYESAIRIYEELNQLDKNSGRYYSSLNRLYVQLKNYAASVNLLEGRIASQPSDVNAYGMLGSTYHLMGNEEKAKETWFKPFSLLQPDPIYYRTVANYAVERRAFDVAIELYKKGKDISEDKILFSNDLAQLYTITMQFKSATEEYCSILETDPFQLENVKTRILSFSGKPDALKISIDVVKNRNRDNNPSLSYLLAHLYTEANMFDEAFSTYLSIDETQSKQGADLFNYAQYLLKEKQYQLAEDAFKKIIELYPNSMFTPISKLGYAKALEAKLMEEYFSLLPSWKTYYPVVKYESENVFEVINAFKDVMTTYGKSEASYEAMFRVGIINYYLVQNSSEAFENFNRIIKEAPTSKVSVETFLVLGDINLLEGKITEAENYYLKVISSRGAAELINTSKYKLARINLYKGNFDSSKQLLQEITGNLKDDFANDALELLLLLNTNMNDSSNIKKFADAEFLVETKKFKDAASIFRMISQDPKALVMHSISSLRFAQMLIAADSYPEGITAFQSMVESGDKNIFADKALYLMGQTYQHGMGDDVKAIECYENILVQFPNSIYLDEARENLILLKNKLS